MGLTANMRPLIMRTPTWHSRSRETVARVLYQPLSVVIHSEGITSGTDTSAGIKKYQEVNRETFITDLGKVLACRVAGKWRFSSHSTPLPKDKSASWSSITISLYADRDSGSLRMFNILTILHKLQHQVTFIPDNLADIAPYGDELRKRGIKFLHHPYINSVRDYLHDEGRNFDVVILSRCDFARKHIADVRAACPAEPDCF